MGATIKIFQNKKSVTVFYSTESQTTSYVDHWHSFLICNSILSQTTRQLK